MSRIEIGLAVIAAAAPGCGLLDEEVIVEEAIDFVLEVVELIVISPHLQNASTVRTDEACMCTYTLS